MMFGVRTPLILSLTLGLAPFFPEPHIWGKLRWLAGGADGMKPVDWFDFAFHGFPWLWLLVSIIFMVHKNFKNNQ